MREIKFKVWNKNWNVIGYVYKIDFDKKMIYYTTKNSLLQSVHFVNAEIMQYTGLKDKNDKEIYEGDIIKVYDEYEILYGIGNITFCCGCWYVEGNIHELLFDLKRDYYFEVIGNIFENTELLDKEG